MPAFMRKAVVIASGIVTGAMLTATIPNSATAAPIDHEHALTQSGYACGYDGFVNGSNSQPLYTHCGTGRVEIEVDHFFWQTTYWCASPGTHDIPQGNSQWRIYNAVYDGKSC